MNTNTHIRNTTIVKYMVSFIKNSPWCRMKFFFGAALLAGFFFQQNSAIAAGLGTLAFNKHNLTSVGPGPVKATTNDGVCTFCHTPHNANLASNAPLWNQTSAAASTIYTTYQSSTTKSIAANTPFPQPDGSSLYCLSCHDGVNAINSTVSRGIISMAATANLTGGKLTPGVNSNLGKDLSDDHPISFTYPTAQSELLAAASFPAASGKVKLFGGKMQCITCHDSHDDTNGKFLVISNSGSALCEACHLKGAAWAVSSHKISTANWNGSGTNPWPHTSETSVATNSCENCHRPHTAGGKKELLNTSAPENNCLPCHNGNVAAAALNIDTVFKLKPGGTMVSIHPITNNSSRHDAAEANLVASGNMHVTCVDCHNPHASKPGSVTPKVPGISLTQFNVNGITVAGVNAIPTDRDYEVCFRCHGDTGAALSAPGASPNIPRLYTSYNIRKELLTPISGRKSFHPVASSLNSDRYGATDADTPIDKHTSLNGTGWSKGDRVTCVDCHNNDAGTNVSGQSGPRGPHGSKFPYLLEREYKIATFSGDYIAESAANFALCYKCHNRNTLLGYDSFEKQAFKKHKDHLKTSGVGRVSCSVCHDPHGIDNTIVPDGTALKSSVVGMVNFDTRVVQVNDGGLRKIERFYPQDNLSNPPYVKCWVKCHTKNHDGTSSE